TRNVVDNIAVGEGSRSDPSPGWFDVKPAETVLAARAHACALRAFWRERVARILIAAQPLANRQGGAPESLHSCSGFASRARRSTAATDKERWDMRWRKQVN